MESRLGAYRSLRFIQSLLNYRIVRLTSPNMNYFIILGAAVCLCAIFVHLIRSTDPEVHRIRCYVSLQYTEPLYANT